MRRSRRSAARSGARVSKPLRLMLAIGGLGAGGSEKQLTELLARLPREHLDPVLVTRASSGQASHLSERVIAAGIPMLEVSDPGSHPVTRWVNLSRAYARAVRTIEPDLVYAWLDETAAILAPICRLMQVPCLVARRNLIGSSLERRYRVVGHVMRRAERLATLVTANSAAVAASSVARGHDPARVRAVPNGHEELPALPFPAGPTVAFGYVAQFRIEKGHHRLIDVLERLPPGPWRVDLAGEGPLQGEIEARIARAHLEQHVRLVGPISDVRGFWRERRVAMLLSDSEGMPNALLEAAFAGRPAIATEVGGTPELVATSGILVPLDDPYAVVMAMQALIADPERCEQLGEQAWRRAAHEHSMASMVEAHVDAIFETRQLAADAARGTHQA